jgi:hypothetical protein
VIDFERWRYAVGRTPASTITLTVTRRAGQAFFVIVLIYSRALSLMVQ